jgi:hypothetical protein
MPATAIGLSYAKKSGFYKPKKKAYPGVPAAVANPQPAAAPQSPPAAPPTPHADPYYNPQNQMDLANFNFGQQSTIDEIDSGLRDLTTQTAYQQTLVDDGARKNTGATNDNAAARGISQSSIRDGSLADIEAQRVLQRNYLSDQLANAKIAGDARKAALITQATSFMKGMDGQAVANADEINKNIQPPAADPRAGLTPAQQAATVTTPGGKVVLDPARSVSNVRHVRGKDGYIYKVTSYGDGHEEKVRVGT